MENALNTAEYCRTQVAEGDRERYLMTLFAPARAQRAQWAVWAFNQEIAKIWDSVSEPALAEIRLQWWHEVLDEIQAGSVREQPVIQELALLAKKTTVFPLLQQAIAARQQDIFTGNADMASIEAYAAGAGGALHRAAYLCEQADAPEDALKAAGLLGEAWALLGLVRALPYYWQHNKDLGSEALGAITKQADLEKAQEQLKPIILNMRQLAERKMAEAVALQSGTVRRFRGCLRARALLDLHLAALDKAANNPFELPRYSVSDLRKLFALMRHRILR